MVSFVCTCICTSGSDRAVDTWTANPAISNAQSIIAIMRSLAGLVLRAAQAQQAIRTGTNSIAPAISSRSIQTSSRVFGFGSHGTDNSPEAMESEKRQNLKGDPKKGSGQKNKHLKGAEGWNENLASDSEAAVKAEKHAPDSIEEMQKMSVDHINGKDKERPSGKESDSSKQGKANPVSGQN